VTLCSSPKNWLARAIAVATVLIGVSVPVQAPAAGAALRGVPDSTWQTDGRVRAVAYAAGVVYLGGAFTHVRPPGSTGTGVVRNHAAAFDASTGDLLGWNPNVDGTVWTLTTAGKRIYLGGNFDTVRGKRRKNVAAVDRHARLRPPWHPGANGNVYTIQVGRNGDVYLGGSFTKVGGKKRLRLARVGSSGAVQGWRPKVRETSGNCPPHCSPIVFAVHLSRNRSALYVGGRFDLVNGTERRAAAAVSTSTGQLLPWNPNIPANPNAPNPARIARVLGMAAGAGRVYLCGDFWRVNGGITSPNLAAVDPVNGLRIAAFSATTDGGSPACRVRKGLVYVGGHFQRVGPPSAWDFSQPKAELTGPGSEKRVHIVAFDANTGAISSWNPGMNSPLGVHALASDRHHLGVGGDFTKVAGRQQQGFAQFGE
jgi:hypothetical protein